MICSEYIRLPEKGLTKVIWVILNFNCKRSEDKKEKGISIQ